MRMQSLHSSQTEQPVCILNINISQISMFAKDSGSPLTNVVVDAKVGDEEEVLDVFNLSEVRPGRRLGPQGRRKEAERVQRYPSGAEERDTPYCEDHVQLEQLLLRHAWRGRRDGYGPAGWRVVVYVCQGAEHSRPTQKRMLDVELPEASNVSAGQRACAGGGRRTTPSRTATPPHVGAGDAVRGRG